MEQHFDGLITRIRTFPDDEKALRTPAVHVEELTQDVTAFALDLCRWMRREDGAGLAATQVEAPSMDKTPALFVMARGNADVVCINPTILGTEGSVLADEGCLSFGRVRWNLVAPRTIRVGFMDLQGESHMETFHGFAARCAFHEIDHLKGRLMIDRMLRRDRRRFLELLQEKPR